MRLLSTCFVQENFSNRNSIISESFNKFNSLPLKFIDFLRLKQFQNLNLPDDRRITTVGTYLENKDLFFVRTNIHTPQC